MHDNFAVFVDRVVKNYGVNEILKELCMKVERGTIYGLLGASGCGKTTLLSSIVGRKKIDGGEIWVLGGKPGEKGSGVPGPRVGYMPQDIALVGEFTVKDAVYYFGRIFNMEETLIAQRYRELHNLLELPPDDRYLKNCSGGQQRRVSFACALVHQPELLIMDEPTVGVDPVLRDRIWNYLVDITKKNNISVIITTHYIEEARQAHKIGLMREGRLLAEESPNQLLRIFNTDTLEEVFLILSRRQEEGRLDNLAPIADDQNNSVIEPASSTTSIATVATFDIGYGSKDILTPKKITTNTTLDKNRLKALLDKNWKQFYRNITGVVFLLFFPILQTAIFMYGVGGDIKNIQLAIVNDESMMSSCPDFDWNGTTIPYSFGSCHFKNMSCRFLKYLDVPMINTIPYESFDVAVEDIKHGKVVGVLYFPQNFTEALEQRIEIGGDAEEDILQFGEIKAYMDMSNRQIGQTLKYKLTDLYVDFQDDLLDDCKLNPSTSDIPVDIQYVHGDKNDSFTIYMTPGTVVTIIFFMGAMMTSQIIITDRHEGVWDRSIVAGVSSLEITITHFLLQASIIIIQAIESLVVVYLVFQQEYEGSLVVLYFIAYIQGVCGMSFGFLVSALSTDHSMANIVLTGGYLPMMMLSGLMWPTEGMPTALKYFAKFLPFTLSIESYRNVAKKGWSILNFHVFSGMLVGVTWTVVFGILSVYLIKIKR